MNSLQQDRAIHDEKTLVQKRRDTEYRFTLCGPDELEISSKSKQRDETFRLELSTVSDKPSKQSFRPKPLNAVIFMLFAVAVLFGVPAIFFALTDPAGVMGISLFFAFFAVPSLLLGIRESVNLRKTAHDLIVYADRYTGGVSFIIDANLPEQEQVKVFCEKLDAAITRAKPSMAGQSNSLAGQLTQLNKLFESGQLTEEEFAVAKQRALAQDAGSERAIGFGATA